MCVGRAGRALGCERGPATRAMPPGEAKKQVGRGKRKQRHTRPSPSHSIPTPAPFPRAPRHVPPTLPSRRAPPTPPRHGGAASLAQRRSRAEEASSEGARPSDWGVKLERRRGRRAAGESLQRAAKGPTRAPSQGGARAPSAHGGRAERGRREREASEGRAATASDTDAAGRCTHERGLRTCICRLEVGQGGAVRKRRRRGVGPPEKRGWRGAAAARPERCDPPAAPDRCEEAVAPSSIGGPRDRQPRGAANRQVVGR